MNTKGVNFQPSKRGQFSAAVDRRAGSAGTPMLRVVSGDGGHRPGPWAEITRRLAGVGPRGPTTMSGMAPITVFGRLGRGGWVSVRRGPGEEHQTELAHLNLVAVG